MTRSIHTNFLKDTTNLGDIGNEMIRYLIWKSFAVSERIEEEAGKKMVKRIPRKKAEGASKVSMSTCKHEGCHTYEVQGTEYTTPEGRRVKVVLIKCWCCKKVIGTRPELIAAMPLDVVPYHPLIP